jgi:aldose 1-epimerase
MNLPMENIAIHGMVYNRKFNLTEEESDDTHCSAQLVIKIKPDTFEGYPFAVELSLTYTLREHSFRIDFHLKNTGNTTAPFSLGWHPYFTFAQSLRDVFLKMESEKHVEVDEKLIPTRRLPPCKNSPFDFSAGKEIGAVNLDNGFTVPSDGTTTLYNKKSTLVIHQGTDLFKYIQLYIPVDHKSIAIEPITAPTNSFNFHELGLRILHPGEEVKSFVTVRVA